MKLVEKVLPYLSCLWVSNIFPLQASQHLTPLPSGYYNPILAYGEDKAIQDAAEAGANGYIMVDLPPEEAIAFRDKCSAAKWVSPPLLTLFTLTVYKSLLRAISCALNLSCAHRVPRLHRKFVYLYCLQGGSSLH